ncbi:MAG: hypothetical protein JXN65_05710 [Clostridia bacterium]|nr:hypothetical protein [Clostridia bacterium]
MQEFYLAGYKLVIPTKRYKHMDQDIVPEYFISASSCVSNILVESTNISMPYSMSILDLNAKRGDKALELYQIITQLSINEIEKLNKDMTELHMCGKFGMDGVFSDKDAAIEIYHKYFRHLNDVKLISLGLASEEYNDILETEPIDKNNRYYGIYTCIAEKASIQEGTLLGYEVLGAEFGYSSFHSMFCSGAEKDVHLKFGYTLNGSGLFDEYIHAKNAARYICEEELGEPVTWQPWAIFENKLC